MQKQRQDGFIDAHDKWISYTEIPERQEIIHVDMEYGHLAYDFTVPNLRTFIKWFMRQQNYTFKKLPPDYFNLKVDRADHLVDSKGSIVYLVGRDDDWSDDIVGDDEEDDDNQYVKHARRLSKQAREKHRIKPRKTQKFKIHELKAEDDFFMERKLKRKARRVIRANASSLQRIDRFAMREALLIDKEAFDTLIYGWDKNKCHLRINDLDLTTLHPGFEWRDFYFWKRHKRAFQLTAKYVGKSSSTVKWLLSSWSDIPIKQLRSIICDYWFGTEMGLINLALVRPANILQYSNDEEEYCSECDCEHDGEDYFEDECESKSATEEEEEEEEHEDDKDEEPISPPPPQISLPPTTPDQNVRV